MIETVKRNLLQIQEDIAPYKPNIIAVTKYFDENAIIDAYNAGLRDFAESRVIEAIEKIEKLKISRNKAYFMHRKYDIELSVLTEKSKENSFYWRVLGS